MVLTFTDLVWTKKPPTIYFHVSTKNEQAEPSYDYLFLKQSIFIDLICCSFYPQHASQKEALK